MMTGAGDYEVVIEMDAWLTDILRGRRWHPTQDWVELPGGGSQLRMRLGCLEEIEQWVLSWGTHATVVRPLALVERVAGVAREQARRYGGEDGGERAGIAISVVCPPASSSSQVWCANWFSCRSRCVSTKEHITPRR